MALDTMSDVAYLPPTMTGDDVKTRREQKGWTRTQLAAAVGRSERQIYRYENGESPIDGTAALALEQVLGPSVTVRSQSPRRQSAKRTNGGA